MYWILQFIICVYFLFRIVLCVRMRQRCGVGDCIIIYVVQKDTFLFNLTTIERKTQREKYIAYTMSAERILTALYSTSHEQVEL